MNGKMKAVVMALVMVSAAAIVIVTPFSADAMTPSITDRVTGKVVEPKYIVGSDIVTYKLYTDEIPSSGTATYGVDGKIEFNKSAFSASATVSWSYYLITGSEPESGSTLVDFTTWDTSTPDVLVGKVKINLSGAEPYVVTFHQGSDSGTSKILIRVSVADTAPRSVALPTQYYYWAANIQVINNSANTITLTDDGGTSSLQSPIDSKTWYSANFNYETNVSIFVKSGATVDGVSYKYYATNLPAGLSLRMETASTGLIGVIGGKISESVSTSDYDADKTYGTATIYQVSSSGVVKTQELRWTIGAKVINSFTITATYPSVTSEGTTGTQSPVINNGGYVAVSQTDSLSIAVAAPTGTSLIVEDIKVIANDEVVAASDGKYVLPTSGTGSYKVVVTATVQNGNATPTSVMKTFTVYVVGSVVDSDLDPAVTN